jgi:hypothetical protein
VITENGYDERLGRVLEGMELLIDKDAVQDTMLRVGYSADREDWDGFRAATTEDLKVELWIRDRKVVDAQDRSSFRSGVDRLGSFAGLHGYLGPFQTEIDGDEAHIRFTPQMLFGDEKPVFGIAYADAWFRRTEEGWKNCRIVFVYLWGYEHLLYLMEDQA